MSVPVPPCRRLPPAGGARGAACAPKPDLHHIRRPCHGGNTHPRGSGASLAGDAVPFDLLAGALQARAQDAPAPDDTREPKLSDLLKMPGKVMQRLTRPRPRAVSGQELPVESGAPATVEVEVGGQRVKVSRPSRTVTAALPVRALPHCLDDERRRYGSRAKTRAYGRHFPPPAPARRRTLRIYGDKRRKEEVGDAREAQARAGKGGNRDASPHQHVAARSLRVILVACGAGLQPNARRPTPPTAAAVTAWSTNTATSLPAPGFPRRSS